jgi:hypothetical protein
MLEATIREATFLETLGVDAHRSVFEVAGAQIRLEVD